MLIYGNYAFGIALESERIIMYNYEKKEKMNE